MHTSEEKLRLKKAIASLPVIVQGQIREEIVADRKFKHYINSLLSSSDPFVAILTSQRMAEVNELNPASYPEMSGLWKVFRTHVRKLKSGMGDVEKCTDYGSSAIQNAPKTVERKWRKEYQKEVDRADGRIREMKRQDVADFLYKAVPLIGLVLGVYSIYREFRR